MSTVTASSDDVRALVQVLTEPDCDDDALFRALVLRTMSVLSLSDADIAHEFSLSRPALRMWQEGTGAPHPIMRKHVYEALLKRAQDTLWSYPKS